MLIFQRKLDGYKFPVYSTTFCPRNETEWNERSSALNCTGSNGYICLPNENFTKLLEFCYTQPMIWILDGMKRFLDLIIFSYYLYFIKAENNKTFACIHLPTSHSE